MAADVIVSKLANALIEDAEIREDRVAPAGPVAGVLDAAKEGLGGFWVGGRLTLTRDELAFRPNGANDVLHTGSLVVSIPLRSVEDVLDLPGWFTKIIGVRHQGRTDRFRCFGARKVAQQIREAVAAASQP